MSNYRTLNRTVLAKVESTPGTDASPTVGADAVLVESPAPAGGPTALQTNEVTGGLSSRADVPGGGGSGWNGVVNLRGSGAGGTEPEWGALMLGCAMSETKRATDLTGTAQAGSTSSTIRLAAGATGILVGEMIELTGGIGSGQARVITAWNNTTKDATIYPNWTTTPDNTTQYAVRANALYVPASTSLKNLSIYDYVHATPAGVNSKLRKFLGAAGEVGITLPVRGLVKAAFAFQAKFVKPADVSHPGAATYDAQRPIAFQKADISLNGVATKFNTLTLNLGNTVQLADDPADTFGVDIAGVTRRRVNGRINPPMALTSVRDVWQDFLDGTTRKLHVRYGSVLGNKLSFYIPSLAYAGGEDEDINGFLHEGIPFTAEGTDSEVYVCVY